MLLEDGGSLYFNSWKIVKDQNPQEIHNPLSNSTISWVVQVSIIPKYLPQRTNVGDWFSQNL